MSAVGLFADIRGSGPPLLLAHAIGLDHRMWDAIVPALVERHRVIRIDLRGHGASPVPPGPYTLDTLALDCVEVLDRLGIDKVDFIGLSLGGMVGQAFALGHPHRLARLVLANTTSCYGPDAPALWEARKKAVREGGIAAIGEAVATRLFSDEFRARRPEEVARVMGHYAATPVAGYLGCCDAILGLDFTQALARIRAATLVIAGERDLGTPVAMHESLAAGIPHAKLVVIPGAAHLSAVEKPAEFATHVNAFLAARAEACA